MTLDLEKLRAETLALIDGTTPGPWSVFIDDSGGQWTGWPLSVNADNVVDKAIVRPGGHWPYEWDAKTSQYEACQNARLIAAAPTLAADMLRLVDDNLRLMDEIERLRAENDKLRDDMSGGSFYQEDDIDAMQNEIERLREATNQSRLAFAGYVSVESAVRKLDALVEGGPDAR